MGLEAMQGNETHLVEKQQLQAKYWVGQKVPLVFLILIFIFIYFLAVLGLRFCARAFSS